MKMLVYYQICTIFYIIDITEQEEYEKTKAALHLMCELEKGKRSGEEQGWIDSSDVRRHFREKNV